MKPRRIATCDFCSDCGFMLPRALKSGTILECECCKALYKGKQLSHQPPEQGLTHCADPKFAPAVITESKDRDFPSLIRQKMSGVAIVDRHEVETRATAKATCEKCGRTEVKYSMVQLRSADEGSTVFYNCDCGHK